jgi:hypothetical protein
MSIYFHNQIFPTSSYPTDSHRPYHRIPACPSDPSAPDKAGRGLGKGQEAQEEHISEDLRADYVLITCWLHADYMHCWFFLTKRGIVIVRHRVLDRPFLNKVACLAECKKRWYSHLACKNNLRNNWRKSGWNSRGWRSDVGTGHLDDSWTFLVQTSLGSPRSSVRAAEWPDDTGLFLSSGSPPSSWGTLVWQWHLGGIKHDMGMGQN